MALGMRPLSECPSSEWLEWRTDGSAQQRLAYWTDVVCQAVLDVDISTSTRRGYAFTGRINSRRQVHARFVSFRSSGHRLVRTRAHAERIGADDFIVGLQCSGMARIAQERGEISLASGDIGIVDGGRPFHIEFPGTVERRLVIVPRSMLGRTGGLVAKLRQPLRLPATSRLAPAIAQSVRLLSDRNLEHDDPAASVLLNNLAGMLGIQFGTNRAGEEPAGRDAFDRVIHSIDANLESPALNPAGVAAAAGISLRTLHRLFQRHGHAPMGTFEQCVFEKRLLLAHRRLACGANASVTEAALSCGFRELSHFTRRFANRFGLTPSALLKADPSPRTR